MTSRFVLVGILLFALLEMLIDLVCHSVPSLAGNSAHWPRPTLIGIGSAHQVRLVLLRLEPILPFFMGGGVTRGPKSQGCLLCYAAAERACSPCR